VIQVKNLSKYYNDFCAVDKISLNIKKGEILGLLGPNGAGKTTTLRMLTGFLKPSSGNINIKNLSIFNDSLRIKKLIGYLPESAPLYHNMLVFDYLEYVAKIKGVKKEKRFQRFKRLSKLCGLSQIMHLSINELSKGLKQRVGLAHAMMTDPEILILDEPTSGLDPNQIIEIRDIITRIGKEKTIIISTHILSEAEATCNRIVIINKGKIVADDTSQNLKQKAQKSSCINLSLYNAEQDKAYNVLKEINNSLEIIKKESKEKDIISFEIKSPGDIDIRKDIYLKIKETNWIIAEFIREPQTLEKIFQELTRES